MSSPLVAIATVRSKGWVLSLLSILLCFWFLFSSAFGQDQWSSFRNNGRSVVSVEAAPIKWAPGQGITWRVKFPGYGQSSPVVWDDTAYVTSSDGPWQELLFVHAIDLANGKIRWTKQIEATTKVENYFRNSRAAPTCVVDSQRVISFFASGDLTALNHDGDLLWSNPLFENPEFIKNERGVASSPAQNDKHVFILVDHDGPSYLAAIDKADGTLAWKAPRGTRVPSWSSPVIVQSRGFELVVVSSADSVAAYDSGSGELIWEISDLAGNHIPSATVSNDSIYIGSTKMFHQSDIAEEKIAGSNCRIDLQGSVYEMKWGAERANSYYSSPLVFAGYVYYVNKAGVLYCVDARSGKRVFAKRIGNPCWASSVGVEDANGQKFAYFFTKNGSAFVLRPGEQYDQVAKNQLWDAEAMRIASESAKQSRRVNKVPAAEAKPKSGPETLLNAMPESALHGIFSYSDPTVYGVAFAGDRLLVRTGQQLFCIEGRPLED